MLVWTLTLMALCQSVAHALFFDGNLWSGSRAIPGTGRRRRRWDYALDIDREVFLFCATQHTARAYIRLSNRTALVGPSTATARGSLSVMSSELSLSLNEDFRNHAPRLWKALSGHTRCRPPGKQILLRRRSFWGKFASDTKWPEGCMRLFRCVP